MICWSCQKEIPNKAEFCPHCEAEIVEELSVEEEAAATSLLADMSPDLLNELCDVFNKSASGQEFVDRIMVGDCPQCGNSKTGDCENDPEIENPCVGRCFECGLLWCLDCGEFFKDVQSTEHDCPAWEEMDCDDNDLDETD
jgi:hypothetical protein